MKETLASIKKERNTFFEKFIQLVEEGQIDLNCEEATRLESDIRKKIQKPETYDVTFDVDNYSYVSITGYHSDLVCGKDIEIKVFHKGKEVGTLDFDVNEVGQ